MLSRSIFATAIILAFTANAMANNLSWQVVNNFRVLTSQQEQDKFVARLKSYDQCMTTDGQKGWNPLACTPSYSDWRTEPIGKGPPLPAISTRFMPQTLNYTDGYLTPTGNAAVVAAHDVKDGSDQLFIEATAFDGIGQCEWTIDGQKPVPSGCADTFIRMPIGTDVSISASRISAPGALYRKKSRSNVS